MSLYKPSRNPELNNYIRNGRSRNGAGLLPTNASGLRKLLQGLKQGKSCMILPDQKPAPGRGQAETRFFGQIVDHSTLVQQLARKVACPIYIAAAIRNLEQHQFRIMLQPMSSEKLGQPEPGATDYLASSIESMARKFPEQYQWTYRRFRKADYHSLKTFGQ